MGGYQPPLDAEAIQLWEAKPAKAAIFSAFSALVVFLRQGFSLPRWGTVVNSGQFAVDSRQFLTDNVQLITVDSQLITSLAHMPQQDRTIFTSSGE